MEAIKILSLILFAIIIAVFAGIMAIAFLYISECEKEEKNNNTINKKRE